jgi:hypothetical protein
MSIIHDFYETATPENNGLGKTSGKELKRNREEEKGVGPIQRC